jgi:Putative homoserine kinase type II (protein kinase fold)
MVTQSLVKVSRRGCGRKYPAKRRYIRSCARLKHLLCLLFLGAIDLAKIYFLHGAGQIRYMLVMGWGGESIATMELTQQLRREIHRLNKEIKTLGVIHEDLRLDNVLWSEELGRALIIDFHRSTLRCRPAKQRPAASKRRLCQAEAADVKRVRVL